MNILTLLVFCLLAITPPVIARGLRCHSSTQCDYESVCYEGYCYTIDEMFDNIEAILPGTKTSRSKSIPVGKAGKVFEIGGRGLSRIFSFRSIGLAIRCANCCMFRSRSLINLSTTRRFSGARPTPFGRLYGPRRLAHFMNGSIEIIGLCGAYTGRFGLLALSFTIMKSSVARDGQSEHELHVQHQLAVFREPVLRRRIPCLVKLFARYHNGVTAKK
ncbi:hypothetical protein GCK72_009096 [Caenorhabditis remanei]|uniref:Uncharacterized protein n=1 Tax=Caenorhabditis remanei TaxID=31234 RepID=A0A6A5H205_CAERE|nr:hypothetical protein GCK72_009096 [Caenorhabditis remanei]KAF1760846.1 hypothetical protein GCK72_009096 [Caenorhabditis remanei]